jgi:uncharacterized protein YPO0396
MRDGGKGDKQRPLAVSEEQFDKNWDTIFKPNPLADKLVKQIKESIVRDAEEFFQKARIVAKQIDNHEYITPED